jgi:hypothetical protein
VVGPIGLKSPRLQVKTEVDLLEAWPTRSKAPERVDLDDSGPSGLMGEYQQLAAAAGETPGKASKKGAKKKKARVKVSNFIKNNFFQKVLVIRKKNIMRKIRNTLY